LGANEGIKTKNEINKYVNYYHTPLGRKIANFEANLIDRNTPANATLLSIGCGPAIIENILYQSRGDIHFFTLDKNKEMLDNIPLHLRPIQADASHLPFISSILDIIVCVTSLEFMSNTKKALNEIHRVLKPKGKLLAFLLNPQSTYVQQKMREKNSYIGANIQQKTNENIIAAIDHLFNQNEFMFNLSIRNNKITNASSRNMARLRIIKAIK
jgi:ubiquinone/menaquinone biosynthesis C-methylase UbiE